jgi:SET and MYND domain-containing protein
MADEKEPKGATNSSFEIFNVPSRGRGIKTKVPFNKGNCVLSSEAYAFVSRSETLGKICDRCLSASDNLKRCSGCKMVYYCCQACQKNAWGAHKLECKHLKKSSPIMPSDTVRLLALIMLKNDRAKWLEDLVGHSEPIRREKGEVFAYMFEMLNKYLGGSIQWSSERVFELFCKVNCNAFTICDVELRPIGI